MPAVFSPPSPQYLKWATMPWQQWFKPTFQGLENLPDHSRVLFVGNHTVFGLLDAPLLANELYQRRGLYVRGLGDRIHFKVPGWGRLLTAFGAVEGTPAECARLMQANEPVLVFPGGGREVCKRKGEAYQLIWKARAGFARLAAEHNYTIIPFAAVGAEECYNILWDANDWAAILPKRLTKSSFYKKQLRNGEGIFPWVSGLHGTPIPKRSRFYFSFGPAIEARDIDPADAKQVWALRESVRYSIATQLARLRKHATPLKR
ncbi:MAG: acyltransferase family protein [Hahellaceae bacterium]|nr:acyltransferase family protein [Hahellaceae bacterium]MCP5168476.1 acyltransferase family protein [Hahellaceae bacterium]